MMKLLNSKQLFRAIPVAIACLPVLVRSHDLRLVCTEVLFSLLPLVYWLFKFQKKSHTAELNLWQILTCFTFIVFVCCYGFFATELSLMSTTTGAPMFGGDRNMPIYLTGMGLFSATAFWSMAVRRMNEPIRSSASTIISFSLMMCAPMLVIRFADSYDKAMLIWFSVQAILYLVLFEYLNKLEEHFYK